MIKICSRCKKEGEFAKSKSTFDGLQSACKECKKKDNKNITPEKALEIYKKWYSKNKEKHKIRMTKFIKENPEIYRVANKKWRKNNLQYFKNYDNNRYKTNSEYRLKKIISANINQNLNNKTNTTVEYLGISIKEYKIYLESLFKPEMTWSNHGKIWEIDHIIPVSSFDLNINEQVYLAFHYKNTEPKFKTTDIAKEYGYNEIGNRNKLNKIING